jgi:hypothetical protein
VGPNLKIQNVLCTFCPSIQQAKEGWTWQTLLKKRGFGTPIIFENLPFKGENYCLLAIGFLKKNRSLIKKTLANRPLCATNLQLHMVIPAFFFPLLITWKITRGEKMFEVVAASLVHHVGCTPCGLTKIILKPKNKKKYK